MAAHRRHLHFNPNARNWVAPSNEAVCVDVARFHHGFPEYQPTDLVRLPEIAREIGVGAVYLKNETSRCGLPSFKILGASWGTFRAITKRLDLPLDTTLDAIRETLASSGLTIYAATDGNHGRAVGRVAALLGLAAEIHVPFCMHEYTIGLIKGEGVRVIVSSGDYDAAVLDALAASEHPSGLLIQDYAFGDYQEVPEVSSGCALKSNTS
jgi:threonine dehydratase